ncbi:MAG: PAS domain-containing protein [Gammaproteobacteria bacterium]|nr:PAS domain-containing protein [Gammaproteobacteria bacterium]
MKKNQTSLLKDLFDTLPYAICYLDKQGMYQFCNKKYECKIVPKRKDIKGKSILEVLPKEVAEKLVSTIQEALRTKKEISYIREINHNETNPTYISVKVLPVFSSFNESGSLIIEEDITQQIKIESKLQQQLIEFKKSTDDTKSYLGHIISHFPANVYWKDKEGRLLGDNLNHAKIAGFNQSEIIGKTDHDLPWRDQAYQIRANDLEVMETKKTQVFEESAVLNTTGTENTFLTIKAPLYDGSNEIAGVIGISMDITDRKEQEKMLKEAKELAEAANQAKSAFIANMSHDIRTPISGVIGIAAMLENEGDTKKDRDYGQVIHGSSERLLFLLNDILGIISADEIREDNLQCETFNLAERLKHVCELFSSNIEMKDVTFELNTDPHLPEYIVSDRIKIDRILLNLVSNALKFTDQGYVKLDVGLVSNNKENAVIEFVISDSGIGISEDKVEHIFERFYKVTPSYENKYVGYGIGLFIVKRFVTLLGGNIQVNSELGKGSTFRVTLPVKIGKNEDVNKSPDAIVNLPRITIGSPMTAALDSIAFPPAVKKTNPFKVLLIEDDNIARRTSQYFLEAAGFLVIPVIDGEEAINAAKSQMFDLIITDIGLPKIDGNEFTLLIRYWEKKSGRSPLPIIGLSAHASSQIKNESLDVGMNLVLEKPLNDLKIKDILRLFPKQFEPSNINHKPEIVHASKLDLPEVEDALFKLEQFPLLDKQDGIEKASGDKKIFRELLTILVKETIPEELINLEIAHKGSDRETLKKLAHKLKAAALYCGTVKMYYACHYFEHYHSADDSESFEELYLQLVRVLKETNDLVSKYIEGDR